MQYFRQISLKLNINVEIFGKFVFVSNNDFLLTDAIQIVKLILFVFMFTILERRLFL